MPDGLRASRNMLVGAALFLFSGYMIVVPGHLKRVYEDNPQHNTTGEPYAARLWPQIEAYQREHPVLWDVAPIFPPYGWNTQAVFTRLFVQVNWRFLAYLILLWASAGMAMSGFELQKLVAQLNHKEKLDRMRVKQRGGVTTDAYDQTMIEIRDKIQMQASKIGKWWSPNGAIVGGTLSSIFWPIILKWLGFN